MSGYRLENGGRVDRSLPVEFRFDGHSYQGFAGDALASALLANGVIDDTNPSQPAETLAVASTSSIIGWYGKHSDNLSLSLQSLLFP